MSSAPTTFAYRAASPDGGEISGTIDAADLTDAGSKLGALRLRVIEISPTIKPLKPKPLRGQDFIAFNQHLAHLTAAGLPVEHGLRLIAQDLRRGRLATTINQVAADLEAGAPLGEAFDRRRGQFPALYGKLIDAGVRTSNLSGMLFNLGRHAELVQRLRASLWRTMSYPVMVIIALIGVLFFLTVFVLPKFEVIFREFHTRLPWITQAVLTFGRALSTIVPILLIAIVAIIIIWRLLRASGKDSAVADWLLIPMPLIGPVLRRNLLARWCDAVRIGVEAGLDLPAAIELAGDAVRSPRLRSDGQHMIDALRAGMPVDTPEPRSRMIPASIPAAMAIATQRDQLPATLETLSRMYEEQAEIRLATVPVILTPILLVLIALAIGIVIVAMFAPIMSLFRAVGGWSVTITPVA